MNNYINAENPHLLFNEHGNNPVFAEYGEGREVRFGVSSTYVRPNVVSYSDGSRGSFWSLTIGRTLTFLKDRSSLSLRYTLTVIESR